MGAVAASSWSDPQAVLGLRYQVYRAQRLAAMRRCRALHEISAGAIADVAEA